MLHLKHPYKVIFSGLSMAIALAGCAKRPTVAIASPVEIHGKIMDSQAPLLLVHCWATWCHPCREEFPELVRIYNRYQAEGLELLLISADDPLEQHTVSTFLEDRRCPVGTIITDRLDQDFIETLSPNWEGSLPASFFFVDGKLQTEWEGKRDYLHYAETIEQLLKSRKGAAP